MDELGFRLTVKTSSALSPRLVPQVVVLQACLLFLSASPRTGTMSFFQAPSRSLSSSTPRLLKELAFGRRRLLVLFFSYGRNRKYLYMIFPTFREHPS